MQANKIDKLSVVEVGSERPRNGKAPDVIVTQQVVAPGAAAVFIQRRTCEQCDDDTLRQHVTAMTKKLLEDAASGTSKTILTIKSSPPGAWITLDGDTAGATDSTLATFPGKHTVMLRATGYETEVRDVTAVEGQATELAVTMRPTPGTRPTDPKLPGVTRRSSVLPWVVAGAGVASLIAGGILIAIDQDPDPSPDGPFEIRNTAPAGVGIAIAGVLAVGIGGYLAYRSTRSSRPTAALTPSSASVGWEVRF
ncbi:MAG: PEGA domain-containing protein [Deltaproteobacteria bacterium]|nr:PEGA domain-containing protein [Deltaproteobacteria bacterium]